MCRPSRSCWNGWSSLSNQAPIYLVADLHLHAERPETTRLFFDFLDGPARAARALYILGDLFEAWIGDDAGGPLGDQVARHLAALARAGTRLYFICGNRDFLLSEDFCQRAEMRLLEEPELLEHGDHPILLLHGDVLCTDDVAYQRFRRKVRQPSWQRRILSRPIWWRRMLARLARLMSRRHTGNTEAEIMDVNADTVHATFRHHQIQRIIHGHTHRRAIHQLSIDGRHCQRIVLGDWHETGSAVCIDEDQISMLTIAPAAGGKVELLLHETAAPLVGP